MFSSLPQKFGGYPVVRQWIPKAKSKKKGALPPRSGKLLDKVTAIVIGDTGRPSLTAIEAAKDLAQSYGHFLIDHQNIIECVPVLTSSVGIVEQALFVKTRAPNGTDDLHETSLTINLCLGGPVVGADVYARCVALTACLCERFSLDPAKDVKRAGDLDPARRDPEQALQTAGSDFEKLKAAVAAKLNEPEAVHA
jgi:hypothetical protein